MQLSLTLTWLVDAASASPGAERFLAALRTRLIADHILSARRAWLWRAGNGEVIEAVGFAPMGLGSAASSSGDAGRSWLAGLSSGAVHEDTVGTGEGGPVLGWIGPRRFTEIEADRLREAARFAA